MQNKMVLVFYKKSGELVDGKKFPAVLYYDRKNGRRFVIGPSPVKVTEEQYKLLKKKYGDDVVKYDKKRHKVPEMKAEDIKSVTMEPAKKVKKQVAKKKKVNKPEKKKVKKKKWRLF